MKPPLWLYALAAIIVAALIAWALWSFDPFGRRKHAEAKAEVATQQTHVEAAKTEAVEKVFRSEVVIRQQQAEAISRLAATSGNDTPLDPQFSAALSQELSRMREDGDLP